MSILDRDYFRTDKAAFAHLESVLWADGVVCPHCGVMDQAGRLKGVRSKPSKKNPDGVERHGLWKCYACRKQFTVKVGTVFEDAHIPLHKMLQAVHLLCSSKKGISAHQLHRILEVDYKSAWFLAHRIREAMRTGALEPMGGAGQVVEVDETFFGKLEGQERPPLGGGASSWKNTIMTLVERGGSARSFHVASTTLADVVPVIRKNIARESAIHTDQGAWYRWVGKEFADHQTVDHGKSEYVRRRFRMIDDMTFEVETITTNTVEGYYSIFKRGMRGIYQHCAEKHLHRYLAEFDFRYSNRVALGCDDVERTERALKGVTGKRLTYRQPVSE